MQSLKTIWQEWRHLIVLGGGVVGFSLLFPLWAHYRANLPVVPEYRRYLDYLTSHSPKARGYAEAYYREHSRDTVASKHFEHVCAAMTGLAVEDGFTLKDYPDFPAEWCHERSAYFSEFLQPQEPTQLNRQLRR
jgi:hypothetical protein